MSTKVLIGNGAIFSDDRVYRYQLRRVWGPGDRLVAFIGLNPSTADEEADDPTIRRCIGFARRWGYDGLVMYNLFAYRSTQPEVLFHVEDPVGPLNDAFLSTINADLIVAAWGVGGGIRDRGPEVVSLLPRPPMCLGKTQAGHPRHPLYLRADTELVDA